MSFDNKQAKLFTQAANMLRTVNFMIIFNLKFQSKWPFMVSTSHFELLPTIINLASHIDMLYVKCFMHSFRESIICRLIHEYLKYRNKINY